MSLEQKQKTKNASATKEYDIFRSRPLRYFGYANEFVKSLRSFCCCNIGNMGSIITLSYIFSDVFEKSRQVAAKHNQSLLAGRSDSRKDGHCPQTIQQKVAITAGDALLWQTLASVLLPSIILDAARLATCRLVSHACASKNWVRTAPAIVALGLIPFIIDPIDQATNHIVENSYRQLLRVQE